MGFEMTCKCKQHTKARPMFGKTARVAVVGPEGPCVEYVMEAALNVVERFEAVVTRDCVGSELSELCSSGVGTYVPVSEWLWHILRLANDIAYRSDGLFDVAAAGTDGAACWTDVDLSCKGMVRLRRPLFLSLGGLAKGYAVDLAVKALKETGVQAGLVDIGGCIRAFGPREWRIDFAPGCSDSQIIPVTIKDDALAGCGRHYGPVRLMDFERGITMSSQEWGDMNILVRAQSCAVADALAKVAAINPVESEKMLKQFGANATVLTSLGAETLKYTS